MSNKATLFWSVDAILIVASALICFKNFATFKKALYWYLFPNYISIWSKKLWEKDFENSYPFKMFVLLSIILIGINLLIFTYLVPSDI